MEVAEILASWLARSPQGEMRLGTDEAKNAIKALANGWSAGLIDTLAAHPLSLTELDRAVAALSYPSLERRLLAMRLLGLVEVAPAEGRGTPYAVTDWLRAAVAPLAAAARWERQHRLLEAAPITNRDVEAAFLLALPLLRVSERVEGSCRLAVEAIANPPADGAAGVIAEARDGAVVLGVESLDGDPDAWASGSCDAWWSAVFEGDATSLELGGRPSLAADLVEEFHRAMRLSSVPADL